ncbi:hypothetical protein BC629DRAFT_258597 [Irpex lacteus]|nr:hypothetical protein BC629DRAFT_258597 [Irpex lacteus]
MENGSSSNGSPGNSTILQLPDTQSPDTASLFQPSSADIRVNVLWFASLLFSLIAASFGILVKQWLREYMAVQNTSPQARLRLRHLRYPELAKWKVFEIAALLPLILQLSLSLFLLGYATSLQRFTRASAIQLCPGSSVGRFALSSLPSFHFSPPAAHIELLS